MTYVHKPDTEVFCYIARRKCGCICCVTLDDPDDAESAKSNAKDVAEWMRHGLTIERMTVAAAKTDPAFFPKECPHRPKLPPDGLFTSPAISAPEEKR